jgi:hypothetical protein
MAFCLRERFRRQRVSQLAGGRLPGSVHSASTNLPPAAATRPATSEPARIAAMMSTVPPVDFSTGPAAQAVIFRLRLG